MGGKTVALFYRWFSGLSIADWVKKCRVVYWPVDVAQLVSNRPNPEEILQMREELGVGSEDFVIGRFGRADPAKWDSIQIETFRILLRYVPSAKLLIVGGVPAEIWKLVKKWGLEGSVVVKEPELDYAKYVRLYYLLDVYFHTSRIGEAFSRTIVDAMAAQRPVVVNSTPYAVNGQVEQVDNGVDGFVADTPRTLAAAIAYLFEHPEVASKMGENGLLKVKPRFDAPLVASYLMKCWVDVLRSKRFKFSEHEQQVIGQAHFPMGEDFSNYASEYDQRLHAKFDKPTVRDLVACNIRYLWFARNIRMQVRILESRFLPLSLIKHRSDIASPTRSLMQLHAG
jgi:glycosyltransferase involved in cell wall biosynthesis